MAWKGTVYPRGRKLWIRHKNTAGEWTSSPTPFFVGQEEAAEALLAQVRARVAASEAYDEVLGPLHGTHDPPFYICGSDQWVAGYMEGAVRTGRAAAAAVLGSG